MTGPRIKALVVDDDDGIRILLRRVLENAGYSVEVAPDGQSAIEQCTSRDFDVVLLDIYMPGMTGIEVLRWISENKPAICPVMITAVVDVATAVEAMKLGAYDYITKPFTQDDVFTKIRLSITKKRQDIEDHRRMLQLEERVVEQTERLQLQFTELVETLAREHSLLYKMAENQKGGTKNILRKLHPELQVPMSSVEEFSEALLRILKQQTVDSDTFSSEK